MLSAYLYLVPFSSFIHFLYIHHFRTLTIKSFLKYLQIPLRSQISEPRKLTSLLPSSISLSIFSVFQFLSLAPISPSLYFLKEFSSSQSEPLSSSDVMRKEAKLSLRHLFQFLEIKSKALFCIPHSLFTESFSPLLSIFHSEYFFERKKAYSNPLP